MDLGAVTTLLCDADGNLFPSEEPAFDASATVVNRVLSQLGVPAAYTGTDLRRAATGRNFRSIVVDLATEAGVEVPPSDLEEWVADEVAVVSAHLGDVLRPDPDVLDALTRLGSRFELAVVSSSALSRLARCFTATSLDALFAEDRRFSAQDSLERPTSKPDPAVYRLAGEELGIEGRQGLAIEDAVAGVLSARSAGFEVVGNVAFVAADERAQRVEELRSAGAGAVVEHWDELVELLAEVPARAGVVAR
jgi:HAD superfamily hydrolase (TIGR01509 family)